MAISSFELQNGLVRTVGSDKRATIQVVSNYLDNISLHIDDAEMLGNAHLSQSLTGPLIRFSNSGRYEPYIAERWETTDSSWIFYLRSGMFCEDGEEINAHSFRLSLLRSLRRVTYEELLETPFAQLAGLKTFKTTSADLPGLIARDNHTLEFKFDSLVPKALLDLLSMPFYSYLCSANFDNDKWISTESFVSSGPFRLKWINKEKSACQLDLRKEWPLASKSEVESVILTTHVLHEFDDTNIVQMSHMFKASEDNQNAVKEIPRSLVSLRLDHSDRSYFKERKNRIALAHEIREVVKVTKVPFANHFRAYSFFFGQVAGLESSPTQVTPVDPPKTPLRVRLSAGPQTPDAEFYSSLLARALERLGWPFEFVPVELKTYTDHFKLPFDISFSRAHVDATLDPDFVRLLFMNNLGPRYPDPNYRIADLLREYDKGSMKYREFLASFNTILDDEAAIIPMYHRGFLWKFSDTIDFQNVSPLTCILRYEDLKIKDVERN